MPFLHGVTVSPPPGSLVKGKVAWGSRAIALTCCRVLGNPHSLSAFQVPSSAWLLLLVSELAASESPGKFQVSTSRQSEIKFESGLGNMYLLSISRRLWMLPIHVFGVLFFVFLFFTELVVFELFWTKLVVFKLFFLVLHQDLVHRWSMLFDISIFPSYLKIVCFVL